MLDLTFVKIWFWVLDKRFLKVERELAFRRISASLHKPSIRSPCINYDIPNHANLAD